MTCEYGPWKWDYDNTGTGLQEGYGNRLSTMENVFPKALIWTGVGSEGSDWSSVTSLGVRVHLKSPSSTCPVRSRNPDTSLVHTYRGPNPPTPRTLGGRNRFPPSTQDMKEEKTGILGKRGSS